MLLSLMRTDSASLLKNQIIGHLDRIFPGLVIVADAGKERYTPMFASDFWSCQTMQHLIRVCPDPRQLAAMSNQELIDAFHAHSYAMGQITANKIITYVSASFYRDSLACVTRWMAGIKSVISAALETTSSAPAASAARR